MESILQVLIVLLGPLLLIKVARGEKSKKWLSPVVLAYILGILFANIDLIQIDGELSKNISEASILLAIPLLLFSTNFKKWLSHANQTVISFAFCVISGTIASAGMAYLFQTHIEDIWQPAGMLVGVYTGGTPNMQAIGIGLNAPKESFVLLNAADLLWSGVYLIFLTSVGKNVLAKFLPVYQNKIEVHTIAEKKNEFSWKETLLAIGLALFIMLESLGFTYLFFKDFNQVAFIILLITTESIAASFFPVVRKLRGSFEAGEYLLLIFCVAIGMRSDLSEILQHGGISLFFTGAVIFSCILIHYFLSWIFKIDRDTTMITSTAAIFGPAFVGQIASVLGNRELVIAGVTTGLVGYAIGNYLGMGLGYFLQMALG